MFQYQTAVRNESLAVAFNIGVPEKPNNAVSNKVCFTSNYSALVRPSEVSRNVDPEVAHSFGKGLPNIV